VKHRAIAVLQALAIILAAVFAAAWWGVLRLAEPPSWPPGGSAVTAAGAAAETAAIAGRPHMNVSDLGMRFAWTTAATVEPLVEGSVFYPRMLADIAAAEDSVHLLQFGFKPGDVGDRFAAELEAAARRGVEVRLVVDRYGSDPDGVSREMYEGLVAAGVQVVVNDLMPITRTGLWPDRALDWSIRQLGHHEHRKLLIVDGAVAYNGGAGIEDHFADGGFHDIMVRVAGDIVREYQAIFLTTFAAHGGPVPDDPNALSTYFPAPADAGDKPAVVVGTVHHRDVSALQATRQLIDDARRRIDIANPYFTDDDIVRRVVAAARRGVKVRVLVHSNSAIHASALENDYGRMLDAGIEIWEYPDAVVHAKVLVADDTVMFGTVNLDAWALYRAYEVGAIVKDAATADLVEARLFEPDIAVSTRAQVPTGTDRVWDFLADKLAYFL
jgi:phosphatidylserine/phosphatidylglycerophosphate/cardiolipin synthase-like enzyme